MRSPDIGLQLFAPLNLSVLALFVGGKSRSDLAFQLLSKGSIIGVFVAVELKGFGNE